MKILIADDHRICAESLAVLFEARGYEVIAKVGNGHAALEAVEQTQPDVALLHVERPGDEGVETARRIQTLAPDTAVVLLSRLCDQEAVASALAENCALVGEDEPSDNLLAVVESAARNGQASGLASTSVGLDLAVDKDGRGLERLTERESLVLLLMTQGTTSNRELASSLNVSVNTVKFHVRNILEKLGLSKRSEAIAHALRQQSWPTSLRGALNGNGSEDRSRS